MPLVAQDTSPLLHQPMRTTSSLRSVPLPDAVTTLPSPRSPAPPPSPQGLVSLAGQGRCQPRAVNNHYVDSLRPSPLPPLKAPHLSSSAPSTPLIHGPSSAVGLPCRTNHHSIVGGGGGGGVGDGLLTNGGTVISTQPTKSLKDEAVVVVGVGEMMKKGEGVVKEEGHSSIICAQCGKCRCRACAEPRELPVRWCCGKRYEVSAGKALDYCTCFCCVKGLFYHMGPEEDNACYDRPCACFSAPKCCQRWTCMAVASLALPCLCCYWPLRGCLAASRSCYNCCCRQKGCQCAARQHPPATDKAPASAAHLASQTRRLLPVESESSSSST